MTRWAFLAAVLLFPSVGVCAQDGPVRSLREIRHEHVVLQKYDLSCGAAALATILDYQHGDKLSERDVAIGLIRRDEYIKDPNLIRIRHGFSLLDMNRYVAELGYKGQALGRVDFDHLLRMAPAVVPIRIHGYSHFVVFRGVSQNEVLLADPAYGNRTMSREQFTDVWIDYADFGRVAFAVHRKDGLPAPDQLSVKPVR